MCAAGYIHLLYENVFINFTYKSKGVGVGVGISEVRGGFHRGELVFPGASRERGNFSERVANSTINCCKNNEVKTDGRTFGRGRKKKRG